MDAATLPLPGGRDPVVRATAVDLKMAVKNKFGGKGYQVFFAVGHDTGAQVRRHCDAVAIGIWPSTGHAIHGFEIKVSRGDWLREIADPAKADEIFRFCHRWSLVTPHGLVSADELPPGWGHYTFRDGRLREAVMPKRMDPLPPTPGFMAAVVRRAGERDTELLAEIHRKVREDEEAKREAEIARRVERELAHAASAKSRAVEKLAELEQILGEELDRYDLKPLARAIVAVRKSGLVETYGGLVGVLNTIKSAHSQLERAVETFGPRPESEG